MRAPATRFAYSYSDADWAVIAATLRHLGDANRAGHKPVPLLRR
jgi:hypothetical protein